MHEPSAVVARRVQELRAEKRWSAERLAEACAKAGMPELNRSVIANIESRRRRSITLEEAFTLASVLGVSPAFLLAPEKDQPSFVSQNIEDLVAFIEGRHEVDISQSAPGEPGVRMLEAADSIMQRCAWAFEEGFDDQAEADRVELALRFIATAYADDPAFREGWRLYPRHHGERGSDNTPRLHWRRDRRSNP
jgi:transcriptional regulator with XRE-family HTH domain